MRKNTRVNHLPRSSSNATNAGKKSPSPNTTECLPRNLDGTSVANPATELESMMPKEVNRQRNRVPVIPASGLLDCSRCGQAKPVADFYISRASKRGWKSLCKSCSKDGITKEAKRKVALRPYGMEPEEYDARLSAQLGGCAICGNLDSIEGRSHPVDHCHDCGKVRGILCTLCNTGANWNSVPGWDSDCASLPCCPMPHSRDVKRLAAS